MYAFVGPCSLKKGHVNLWSMQPCLCH